MNFGAGSDRLVAAKAAEALIVLLSLAILFGLWAVTAGLAQSRVPSLAKR